MTFLTIHCLTFDSFLKRFHFFFFFWADDGLFGLYDECLYALLCIFVYVCVLCMTLSHPFSMFQQQSLMTLCPQHKQQQQKNEIK